MRLKLGASLDSLKPVILRAIATIDEIHLDLFNTEIVITSGADGQHGSHSLHYQGFTIDLRTRNLTIDQRKIFSNRVKEKLGRDFDVILESDHMHIEYDPKTS